MATLSFPKTSTSVCSSQPLTGCSSVLATTQTNNCSLKSMSSMRPTLRKLSISSPSSDTSQVKWLQVQQPRPYCQQSRSTLSLKMIAWCSLRSSAWLFWEALLRRISPSLTLSILAGNVWIRHKSPKFTWNVPSFWLSLPSRIWIKALWTCLSRKFSESSKILPCLPPQTMPYSKNLSTSWLKWWLQLKISVNWSVLRIFSVSWTTSQCRLRTNFAKWCLTSS